ncbi:MAG: M28 family peptidase [Verrucomicrobiae bacterium]|nr:M28 family peptidase [Verrucomicrobiae bacterium]
MAISKDPVLAQRLRTDVYDLCLPDGRMVGSAGHAVARKYLKRRLAEIGCAPYAGDSFELPYAVGGMDFTNLIGVIPGSDRASPPLLVGAHYDSIIDAPCADDNGAAVAICLAVAAAAKASGGLSRDLIVAIFDAEEPPYFYGQAMGSTRFYEDQLDARGVHFALIYDLVGHDLSIPMQWLPLAGGIGALAGKDFALPVLKSGVFMTGAESCPELAGMVDAAGIPAGIKLVATLNEYVGDISDHGVFRKNGVPYLFLSCGRWAHYHMPTDTPDRLNYQKMARIMRLSCNILWQAADEPLAAESNDDHTLEYEIHSFKKFAGPLFPILKKRAGISEMNTRSEMSAMVNALLMAGL